MTILIQVHYTSGNSTSFIMHNQISTLGGTFAPMVGYETVDDIQLMAPWDIATKNEELESKYLPWYYGKGIQYRTPENLIDNTRGFINELLGTRLKGVDSKNGIVNRKKPDFSFFIKNRYTDNLRGFRKKEWELCQNVALDLGKKIRIVDKEGFLIQEEMVIDYDLALLGKRKFDEEKWKERIERVTGKKCSSIDLSDKPELSHEELIREVLVRFENNFTSINSDFKPKSDDSDLANMYFTDDKRKLIIQELMNIIKEGKKDDLDQYYSDLELIQQIITEEKTKEHTNGMFSEVYYKMPHIYDSLYKKIDEILIQAGRKKPFIDIDIGASMEMKGLFQYLFDSKIYAGNKYHSTDHIVKTVINLYILAKKEKLSQRDLLLTLICGVLHDNERDDINGDSSQGEMSAIKAGDLLRENVYPFNEFNLTDEEIKIIQIAIKAHDMDERNTRSNNYNRWILWI